VSVSYTVALPAQPTSGTTDLIALGGDGFIAPESSTNLNAVINGDGTGGYASIVVGFDPRFVQLVAYANVKILGLAADTNVRMEIRLTPLETFIVGKTVPFLTIAGLAGGGASLNNVLWTPPPILVSAGVTPVTVGPFFAFYTDNPGVGNSVQLAMRIHNFNKRARELVPLDKLVASVPYASTLI